MATTEIHYLEDYHSDETPRNWVLVLPWDADFLEGDDYGPLLAISRTIPSGPTREWADLLI